MHKQYCITTVRLKMQKIKHRPFYKYGSCKFIKTLRLTRQRRTELREEWEKLRCFTFSADHLEKPRCLSHSRRFENRRQPRETAGNNDHFSRQGSAHKTEDKKGGDNLCISCKLKLVNQTLVYWEITIKTCFKLTARSLAEFYLTIWHHISINAITSDLNDVI
jgi:hypothetical protein